MLILDTDKNLHSFLNPKDNKEELNLLLADKSELLYDYCERIVAKNPEKLLINIEATFENSSRSNLKALDLLYWLRCKHGFKNPILLCGFLTLNKIRSLKPKHTLLDSEGITFFRLPFNLEKAKLKANTNEISDSSLLEHAKGLFYLKQARHDDANWWSMKTLLDCHSLKDKVVYPNIVIEKQKLLNNVLASFIFRPSNSYEADLKKSLQENNIESSNFEDSKKKEKEKLDQQITFYKNQIPGAKPQEKQNYRLQIEALTSKLKTIDKKSNVLMIDDKASEGWKYAQEQVIGVTKNIDIIPFDFSQEKPLSELVDSLWSKIDIYLNENCNLLEFIFLDLKLFPNSINHDITEQYSGLRILKRIKDKYKHIPILITSASNKIWNYQLALSYGADAYWIKEGIESNYEFKDSILNYNKLLDLTKSFTSIEYLTLRKFNGINKKSFQKTGFWWINKKWSEKPIEYLDNKNIHFTVPTKQIIARETVFEYLSSFSKLLNFYVSEAVILNKPFSNNDKKSHFTSLCILIGKIIEIIHPDIETIEIIEGKRSKKRYLYSSAVAQLRGDKVGSYLYRLRNKFSHNNSDTVSTNSFFTDLNKFYNYLFQNDVIIDCELKESWERSNEFNKEKFRPKPIGYIVDEPIDSTENLIEETKFEEHQPLNDTKTILDQTAIDKVSSILNEEKAIERIEIHYKD